MLLADISPTAAKLYIALCTLNPIESDPRIVQIHRTRLADMTNFSVRTCTNALRELQNLRLLTHLPRTRHAPVAFQIHPFPYTQPAAPLSSLHRQPVASMPPTNRQPVAGVKPPTPIPASKSPNRQPDAPNTTFPADDLLLDPATIQLFGSLLTPNQKTELLALAQATLTRLDKEASP